MGEEYEYDRFIIRTRHLHTSFGSFLDGVGKPIEYMKRAAELGQQAVCVTEHGSMASAYEFQRAGDEIGIKTIIGNEMYCVEDRFLQGLTEEEKRRFNCYRSKRSK